MAPEVGSVFMVEDIFDIVDEQDEVIGRDRRLVVHAQHLRHRAIHILLRNSSGRVFLQKRAPTKDKNPDRWDSSCSGHVDSGEDYDQAAVRELGEELGVFWSIEQLTRIRKFPATRETGMEFVWVYFGSHEGPFTLNADEISEGRFWNLPEVDAGILNSSQEFSGAFRFIWQQIRPLL